MGSDVGARPGRFTIKYKPYGCPFPSPPRSVKKKPSDHVREGLDPPLSYRDGVVRQKPCIIEHHNFVDQPYQLMSTVPEDEPLFQPFPPEIMFFGYEAFKNYTTVLHLRNNDKVARRVQVLSRNTKLISVQPSSLQPAEQPTYADIGSSKVAYGMEVAYTVNFNPVSTDDYNLELVVVTDRETFVVPVRCNAMKAVLEVPDEILFPLTPAKCSYKKNVLIHNLGNKAAALNLQAVGAFSVSPTNGIVQAGCLFQCLVCFQPPGIHMYEGELQIHYSDCNEQISSKLIGTGFELEVGLSTSKLAARPTCIRKKSHLSLQIYNHSSVVAYFLWTEFASEQEVTDYIQQVGDHLEETERRCRIDGAQLGNEMTSGLTLEDEHSMSTPFSSAIGKAFSLTPAKGEVWPGTVVEVLVTFCPLQPLRYLYTTCCLISGKSEPLPLQLQGLAVGPVADSETELDLGEICLYKSYEYEVKLENKGHMEVIFRQMMPSTRPSIVECIFNPDSGYLESNEYQAVRMQVSGKSMGPFNEIYLWEIKDAVRTLKLSIKGHVIGPDFNVNVKEVNFGYVSCGLPCTTDIQLQNDGPVSLTFKLRMCSETSHGFTVSPDFFVVHPLESMKVVIELLPLDAKEYDTVLYVDIPYIGDSFASVQLRAQSQIPEVNLSKTVMELGNCFLRHPYTAEVNLANVSKVPARYEVLPQNDSTKDFALVRAKTESGIISACSIISLQFVISTQFLGEISLPVIIRISGKDCTELVFTISAVSNGPSLKIEQQQTQSKSGDADSLAVDHVLDFGKVQVLRDHELAIFVRNLSCIPASWKTATSAKDSVFKVFPHQSILEPYGLLHLQVKAYLDDAVKFKDTLAITFEGGQFLVSLIAAGTGSTLSCNELTSGSIHLGNYFTLHSFSYSFEVHNLGRRPQTLAWENDTGKKSRNKKGMLIVNPGRKEYEAQHKASTEAPTHLVTTNGKNVLSIIPDKITVKPYSVSTFTIIGLATIAGLVNEEFDCKVTGCKETYHLKLAVQAAISYFNLEISADILKFVENNWIESLQNELCKFLTCKNVSELPLSFTLQVKPPFFVEKLDWTLDPLESAFIEVKLEREHTNKKLSMVIHEKLNILYTGTMERASVDLVAEINYPNLHLDTEHIDFGCVLVDTCKRISVEVTNVSVLEVRYTWSFYSYNTNQEYGSECSMLPVFEVYDILPTRGCLLPGEQETVEFSFCAYPGFEGSAVALCEVEAGPQYKLMLKGISGLARYQLIPKSLNFNYQAFNKTSSRDLILTNIGMVKISFQIDLRLLKRRSSLSVTPLSGQLQPSEKQKLTVLMQPGVPDEFIECIKVQVAYLIPEEIYIYGDARYPCITLETTRIRNHKFLSMVNEAYLNLITGLHGGRDISSSQDLETAAGQSEVAMSQQYTLSKQENSHSESSITEVDSVPQITVLNSLVNFAKTSKPVVDAGNHEKELSEVQHAAMKECDKGAPHTKIGIPNLEQIDMEIDRILFKDYLLEMETEGRFLSSVKDFLTENQPCKSIQEIKISTLVPGHDVPFENNFDTNTQTPERHSVNITTKVKARLDVDKLILNKYMCDFGIVILGESRTKCIRVANNGLLPVTFRVDMGFLKGKGVFVEPDRSINLAESPTPQWIDLHITLRTNLPNCQTGQLEYNVPVSIKEGPQSILLLRATVVVPALQLSKKFLEFGMTRLGLCKVMYIRLYNDGDVPCDWNLEKQESCSSQTSATHDRFVFVCIPEAGTIMPSCSLDMQVRFIPTHKKKSYCTTFYINVRHNPSKLYLECKGSSYTPLFSIEPSSLEMGPILPSTTIPAEAKFVFRNNSDEGIEIYCLDFDSQCFKEETILRNATQYNKDSFLLLPPRNAGEPFWDSLSQTEEVLKGLNLTRKVSTQAVNAAQPVSSEKTASQDVTMSTNSLETNRAVFILYGPPLVGKSTQAKLLSSKYRVPVVDIDKLIVYTLEKQNTSSQATEAKMMISRAFSNSNRIEELTAFEKDLTRTILDRLQEADCKSGVVFDGLITNPLEALSLVKCIFFALGLVVYDPRNLQPPMEAKISKQKGGDKGESGKKKMRNKEDVSESNVLKPKNLDNSVQDVNSFGVESEKEWEKAGAKLGESTIIWKGNQCVYVIALKAPRESLQNRYDKIPEMYHAKESFVFKSRKLSDNSTYCKMDKTTLQGTKYITVPIANQEGTLDALHDVEADKNPSDAFSKQSINYPYSSIFPTIEELHRFYSNEDQFYNSLGAKLSTDEAASLEHKIVVLMTNGLDNPAMVLEQELKNLPSPESFTDTASPRIFQVVRKPPIKSKYLEDLSNFKFSILTPSHEEASNDIPQKKGKFSAKGSEKPPNKSTAINPKNTKSAADRIDHVGEEGEAASSDSFKDAQTLSVKKVKGALKKEGQEGSFLIATPDGFLKQSRWVLSPRSNLELLMQFWSTEIGHFSHTFIFEEAVSKNHIQLICSGTCARPDISVDYKQSHNLKSKLWPTFKRQMHLFQSEGILDFGPLPVGKSSEGFPDLPDSQHCIKVKIHNTGVFDLYAEFEMCFMNDAMLQPSKTQAKGQERKTIKQSPFLIHPVSMDLKVDEVKDLNIYAYPSQGYLGLLEGKFICNVKDNPNHMEFKVHCLADTPRLELDVNVITFGRLLVGCEDCKDITIRNVCSLPVHWKVSGLENGSDEFYLSETHGKLLPHTNATIAIFFKAKQEKLYNLKLKLQVVEDQDSTHVLQELPISISQ